MCRLVEYCYIHIKEGDGDNLVLQGAGHLGVHRGFVVRMVEGVSSIVINDGSHQRGTQRIIECDQTAGCGGHLEH